VNAAARVPGPCVKALQTQECLLRKSPWRKDRLSRQAAQAGMDQSAFGSPSAGPSTSPSTSSGQAQGK